MIVALMYAHKDCRGCVRQGEEAMAQLHQEVGEIAYTMVRCVEPDNWPLTSRRDRCSATAMLADEVIEE